MFDIIKCKGSNSHAERMHYEDMNEMIYNIIILFFCYQRSVYISANSSCHIDKVFLMISVIFGTFFEPELLISRPNYRIGSEDVGPNHFNLMCYI